MPDTGYKLGKLLSTLLTACAWMGSVWDENWNIMPNWSRLLSEQLVSMTTNIRVFFSLNWWYFEKKEKKHSHTLPKHWLRFFIFNFAASCDRSVVFFFYSLLDHFSLARVLRYVNHTWCTPTPYMAQTITRNQQLPIYRISNWGLNSARWHFKQMLFFFFSFLANWVLSQRCPWSSSLLSSFHANVQW